MAHAPILLSRSAYHSELQPWLPTPTPRAIGNCLGPLALAHTNTQAFVIPTGRVSKTIIFWTLQPTSPVSFASMERRNHMICHQQVNWEASVCVVGVSGRARDATRGLGRSSGVRTAPPGAQDVSTTCAKVSLDPHRASSPLSTELFSTPLIQT